MRITAGPGTHTVTADAYVLQVRSDPPRAVLADPDGLIWSHLSLLASADRVGAADESLDVGVPTVHAADGTAIGSEPVETDVAEVRLDCASTAWHRRRVTLRCLPGHLELHVEVEGEGTLTDVRLLGGRAVLPNGASGTFRSSSEHRSVFVPTPTEPVDLVRPAASPATLGVVGDATPGRLHAVFSPPPLCLVLGRAVAASALDVPDVPDRPGRGWLGVGVVAPVADLRFTEVRYQPVDGGFLLELDHDAHTRVDGRWRSPAVVLRPAADPWAALADHRADLVRAGAPAGPVAPAAAWWAEPLFCGWGAQCARAPLPGEPASHPYRLADLGPAVVPAGLAVAPDLARQDVYDALLAHLERHDVVPGTVVVDDKWQAAYGTGEPDAARWPDLRAWVASRHAAGQRVLLWWKAWDPEGLPVEECLVDAGGRPVAADPASPAYRERVRRTVAHLLGPDGVDADGFKVDFTQRAPAGHCVHPHAGADPRAPWGVAALHALLGDLYRAAKAAKPDALVVTHTPHPAFADVCDMVRLNDVLERDTAGAVVPLADQMRVRRAIAAVALPGHLLDTDQWPMLDVAQWRDYVAAQGEGGVPALYYAERIDRSGEPLTAADLALVAAGWRAYRAARGTAVGAGA